MSKILKPNQNGNNPKVLKQEAILAMKMLKKSIDILTQDNCSSVNSIQVICQIADTVLQYLYKLEQLTSVDAMKVAKLLYCMSDRLLKKEFVDQSLLWMKLLYDRLTDKRIKKKDLDNDEHQKLLLSGYQLLWSSAFRIEKWNINQREDMVLKCRKLSLKLAIAGNQNLDWIVDKVIRSCHSYLFKFNNKGANHYQVVTNFYCHFESWARQQLEQLMAWLTCDDQQQLINLFSLFSFYSNYWCCHYLAGQNQEAINLIKQLNKLLSPKQSGNNKRVIALINAIINIALVSIEVSSLDSDKFSANHIYIKQNEIIQACQQVTKCLKSVTITDNLFMLIELFETVKLIANNQIHDYAPDQAENKRFAFSIDSYNRLLNLSLSLAQTWQKSRSKAEKFSKDIENKLSERYLPLLTCNYKIISLYIKYNETISTGIHILLI